MLIAWLLLGGLSLGGLPWLLALLGLPRWVRHARLALPSSPAVPAEDLHIVIPARDEEAVITACITALRAVPGPWSATVVDDHSSDATAARALEAIEGDPRISLRPAPARPEGWAGKAWACRAGVRTSDWLLFVDADVTLDPRLPGALLDIARARDLDLVSVFGTWELPTLSARWAVPALGWLVRGAADPVRIEAGRQAFANGQVMLVRGEVYRGVGGHEVVRDVVLDDVGMARAVQSAGHRVGVRWAPDGFSVRAYDDVAALVRGYRKNLVAGLGGRRILGVLAAVGVLWAYLGPVLGLLGSALLGPWWLVPVSASGVLLIVAVRLVTERLDGRAGWLAVLHPLAGLPIAWAFLQSSAQRRTAWKGRTFEDGHAR